MQLGALIPLGDLGGQPAAVREYAQAMEAMGYDFLEAPDHVLGANVASRPDWDLSRNTSKDLFHDPFVLFGFSCRLHERAGLFHRRADPAAAPNRAGGEAGGLPGCAVRGPVPARHRGRLERSGVHRPE
jgi:hypothetical protein